MSPDSSTSGALVLHIAPWAVRGGCEINCLRVIEATPEQRHRVVVLGGPGPMVEAWQGAGAEVDVLDIWSRGWVYFVLELRRWWRAFPCQPIGILCWSTARLPGVLWALQGASVPWVVHAGNPAPAGFAARFKLIVWNLFLPARGPFVLAACSNPVANSFTGQPFYWRARIVVVPNPIPAVPPVDTGANDPSPRIGMVARLDPIKDHASLLRSLPLVVARFPSLRFELVGDGILRGKLEALATSLGVGQNVRFLGEVQDVRAAVEGWSLFVYATSAAEGFGNALAEALMAGLPCVASDLPVMREVCGEHGAHYVSPDDPAALAEAVIDLLGNAAARRSLGQAARSRALAHFQSRTVAVRYLALLQMSGYAASES